MGKPGFSILLRKFRFIAYESIRVEVWLSESSVGWSQSSMASAIRALLQFVVSVTPTVPALAIFFHFADLLRAEQGWSFGAYTPALPLSFGSLAWILQQGTSVGGAWTWIQGSFTSSSYKKDFKQLGCVSVSINHDLG